MLTSDILRALPKCEFHRHLEGSVRLETIADLARIYGLELGCTEYELPYRATVTEPMDDLQEVLDSFSIMQQAFCCYEAIKRITFENIEDAHNDGVKLLELRFAPSFIAVGKELENDEIIEAVLDGIDLGMERYPVQVGLIGIVPRAHDWTVSQRATRDLIAYARGTCAHRRGDRICGFDLADDELGTPHERFTPLVDAARSSGLGITVHTGENSDAACMEKSLDLYKPDRIGHGIQAWKDEPLMKRIADEDIMLELCPTSNFLTRSVPSLDRHPLPLFKDRGLAFSVNSDDPHLMNIDLVHEYEVCATLFGFDIEDFRKMNERALSHSFLSEDVRNEVRKYFKS
jgi:adenosine deaminase